jgi:hypothetical protein
LGGAVGGNDEAVGFGQLEKHSSLADVHRYAFVREMYGEQWWPRRNAIIRSELRRWRR